MTELHKKKDVMSTNTVNPIITGIAGVIAGGVAVAAALLMSDKKNQKKLKDVLDGAKEKVTKYMDAITSQPIIEKSVQKLEDKV